MTKGLFLNWVAFDGHQVSVLGNVTYNTRTSGYFVTF